MHLSSFHLLLLIQLQLQSNACLFVCFAPQQPIININNINTSSIEIFVTTMTSFPSSATRTPQQQLQLECDLTMAIVIVTCRQQHSIIRMRIGNREMGSRISKQHLSINMDVRTNNAGDAERRRKRDRCIEGKDVWLMHRGE